MSELERQIIFYGAMAFAALSYGYIFYLSYSTDPDVIKRRKKALKAKRKMAAKAS